MSRPLRVLSVGLAGAAEPHEWRFPAGVTVIEGAIGGGKTSLLNLIEHGFGGDPELTPEIRNAAAGVTLELSIGGRRLQITRIFDAATVEVTEQDRPKRRYALKNGRADAWVSDLLLGCLGIPTVRVRSSRARNPKSHKLTSLSFLDVLAFCYLDQDQVDRSTMHDQNTFRDPKRLWTFELLYGLIDEDVARFEAERELLTDDTEKRRQRVRAVEAFAADNALTSGEAASTRLAAIGAREAELRRSLERVRQAFVRAPQIAVDERAHWARVDNQLRGVLSEVGECRAQVQGVTRAANQIERDIAMQVSGLAARALLEPLLYRVCPRCEQRLSERPIPRDHCPVCLQPDPQIEADDPDRHLRHLRDQLAEARALQARLTEAQQDAERRSTECNAALGDLRATIDRLELDAARPYVTQIADIEAELGALRGEHAAIVQTRTFTKALRQEQSRIADATPAIERLAEQAKERRETLAPSQARIDDLSLAFEEILKAFTLPWLTEADVDPETYLPRVNGRSLLELSSGGMKATTNAAYYLASLVTALRDRDILTPSFLMLDSIRKGHGAGVEDLARAERVYAYLRTLQDLRPGRGAPAALAADFQLILVDNDLPPAFVGAFHTIRIDPKHPLIRA